MKAAGIYWTFKMCRSAMPQLILKITLQLELHSPFKDRRCYELRVSASSVEHELNSPRGPPPQQTRSIPPWNHLPQKTKGVEHMRELEHWSIVSREWKQYGYREKQRGGHSHVRNRLHIIQQFSSWVCILITPFPWIAGSQREVYAPVFPTALLSIV